MYCPVCKDKELVMSERQSIEIDYCPGCRGVWLDRGELDKIIQQSTQEMARASVPPTAPARHQPEYRSGHHGSQYDDYRRPKKKESFWQELFD
ncbi:zf-TFIIB domain-containing protein [Collimonas sp.]|jgi:Zn-finger nucleic acid-binding protein|uniref:TFIIB-type zinc ribbon-containing protein n=1 Tax=Collimonas sp. TaxID=1963772 RepID=UPI002BC47C68|nr:zf-TFIIB domain-containing protein [Collimonas sp.]HWW08484.1 zf-TFIIB domain-containing protein [Collimonas sp.]